MEELRKQIWAKVVAMLLAIISGFVLAVTAVAAVLFGTVPEMQIKQSELEKAMQKQILDICYDAVIEIRDLLAQMKKKREYVAEAYLPGNEKAGNMISLQEWNEKNPANS